MMNKAPMQRGVTRTDLILAALGLVIAGLMLAIPTGDSPIMIDMSTEVSCDDGTTFDSGNGDGPDQTRGTGGGRGVRQYTS